MDRQKWRVSPKTEYLLLYLAYRQGSSAGRFIFGGHFNSRLTEKIKRAHSRASHAGSTQVFSHSKYKFKGILVSIVKRGHHQNKTKKAQQVCVWTVFINRSVFLGSSFPHGSQNVAQLLSLSLSPNVSANLGKKNRTVKIMNFRDTASHIFKNLMNCGSIQMCLGFPLFRYLPASESLHTPRVHSKGALGNAVAALCLTHNTTVMWSGVLRSVRLSCHIDVLSLLSDEEQGEGLLVVVQYVEQKHKGSCSSFSGSLVHLAAAPRLFFLKWGSCFNREIIRMWEATTVLGWGLWTAVPSTQQPCFCYIGQASDGVVMQGDLYRARYSVFIGVPTNNTAVPNCLI